MFSYKALLSHQAQVPENQSLEPHFKQSIEFDILCPVSGCKSIKANGFDYHLKEPVQTYKCKIHERYFFAHTSWLMVKLTEIIIERILLAVFSSSTPGIELAERYNLSAPILSRLVVNCEDYVDSVISKINQEKVQYHKLQLPSLLETVIWIDETFFKVGKKSWALILAIDCNGNVLGWKFGKTRNAKDIENVLIQVGENMPDWSVVIGDGAKAYAKAIRTFRKRAYLIQQFHTHPWERARITEFSKLSEHKVREDIIEFDYRAFVNDEPQIGYAIQREFTMDKPEKRRGRPKGVKNGEGKKKVRKLTKSKRGPKSLVKSGRPFQFGHTMNFLEINWLGNDLKTVTTPDRGTVMRLLNTTFMIYGNRCIVSNRIESFNSQIKQVIPQRGMRDKNKVENRIERFIQLNNRDPIVSSSQMTLPISSKLGFDNLNKFFISKPNQISLERR